MTAPWKWNRLSRPGEPIFNRSLFILHTRVAYRTLRHQSISEKPPMKFVHLHVRSYYSYGTGASSIRELVSTAKQLGYDTLALTDDNTVAGTVEFYQACREAGLFAIIGCRVDDRKGREAVLLCRNITGYHRLNEIVTERYLNATFDLAGSLAEENRGLFILTPSTDLLRELHGRSTHVYGEIVPVDRHRRRNRAVQQWCERAGLPMVLTNDVCFTVPGDFERHRVLSAIKHLQTIQDETLPLCDPQQYLRSPDDMTRLAEFMPDALANTAFIAARCQFEFVIGQYHCARFPLPKPFKSAAGYLRHLALEGLERRYPPRKRLALVSETALGTPSHKPVRTRTELFRRLEYELEVIHNLDFSDYFLICWDLVTWAHGRGLWHVGRGSAANSLVSYCLGLTEVDPIRYHLYFERFLNYARGSPPDIDLDFSWRHRDTVLKYIYDRYGDAYVAMMASIHTYHARGALREVAKAHGISERELSAFRRQIPHTSAANLPDLAERYPEARALRFGDDLFRKVIPMASALDGFPNYSGIHASGVVITEKPVTYFSALERSANGFVKTQFDMHSGEDIGLIKIDILAVRGLGTIEDAVRNIEAESGQSVDIFNWEKLFSDDVTKALLRSGRSIGVVHAESPFIRNALRITKADTFELVYIVSGMVRTGCVESGMMYMFIERLLDPARRRDAHPALLDVLPETFGVMIFEEDVIKVLHFVGGLTLEEADTVRRFLAGKRISASRVMELRRKFVRTCQRRLKDRTSVDTLWRQIESFSGFSFCKAHSASYALMSIQGAYLKAHFPAHYMAAVLSNEGGFYSPAAYVSECRRLGLAVLPPDINRSGREYRAEGPEAIRVGLRFIAGLSVETVDRILRERAHGEFTSLPDFHARVPLTPDELTLLIKIGCFDFTGKRRTVLVNLLDMLLASKKKRRSGGLFDMDLARFEASLKDIDDLSAEEKRAIEASLLGYDVGKHPLEYFPRQVNHRDIVKSADLPKHKGKKVKMIGWLVSSKRIRTRDRRGDDGQIVQEGRFMKFMTLEDLTGVYDVVIFPDVYEKAALHTLSTGPFCLEGIVDARYQTVNVTRIELVTTPRSAAPLRMLIEKTETYARQKSAEDVYVDPDLISDKSASLQIAAMAS